MKHEFDKKIDAVLYRIARVQPEAGLEKRVRERLERESARIEKGPAVRLRRFFLAQRLAFAAAATVAGCAVMVVGSVQHSRQKALEGVVPPAGIHLGAPESGVGAASGARISPQPMVAPENTHARSERKITNGRATVLKDVHKPTGVAVPRSPEQKP
jgi:hypothetical protein